jgi:hypothetical protein
MACPAGLVCIIAYHALGIAAWKEKHPPAQATVGPPVDVSRQYSQPSPPVSQGGMPPPATDLPGLLGYWSFDDESQAPHVADQSGRGNHATVRGATWTKGVRGKALAFNGSDAHLDYGPSPDFNFPARAAFTLACWVKTRATSGVVCGQRSSSGGEADIELLLPGQGVPVGVVVQDEGKGQARTVGPAPINDDAWHHLALTRDVGGTIELFVDGVSGGRVNGQWVSGALTTDLRVLGAEPHSARPGQAAGSGENPFLAGAIDEFCILGRKLTDGEIRKLAGRPSF